MNPDQIERFRAYFIVCWPMAGSWTPAAWAMWADTLSGHGPRFVREAMSDLLHDRRFAEFPPGLAAFMQALDRAEASLRDRIERIEDAIVQDRVNDNAERVREGEQSRDQLIHRLRTEDDAAD